MTQIGHGEKLVCIAGDAGSIPAVFPGEEMTTHCKVFLFGNPMDKEPPGGLQSMGLKSRHDWATEHAHRIHSGKTGEAILKKHLTAIPKW